MPSERKPAWRLQAYPEISVSPDFQNTYPPHCLRGTRGARKIDETDQVNPFPFSLLPYPPGLVPGLVAEHREILLLKKNFNVFTNPNTEPLVDAPPVMIAWPFLFCQNPIVSAPVCGGIRQTCTDAPAVCPVSTIFAVFG